MRILLNNSDLLLDKLAEILYNKLESAHRSSRADYDSPSWAFLQADSNGYQRALREVLELIPSTKG